MITETELKELKSVLNALEDVVAEAGESYVYPASARDEGIGLNNVTCWYVSEDDKPDCIVARTLAKLGWTVEKLRSYEGTGVYTATEGKLNVYSRSVLALAQREQDAGEPWGKCLKVAKGGALSQILGAVYAVW